MRAAIFDPATPDRVRVYNMLVYTEPSPGNGIAIVGVPAGTMTATAQPEGETGGAAKAVLSQLAVPAKDWSAPPVPIDVTLPVPRDRAVLFGAEVPEEFRAAIRRYLEKNP